MFFEQGTVIGPNKSDASNYHLSRRVEVDQPETVIRGGLMAVDLCNGGPKDESQSNLRIKVPEDNFRFVSWVAVVCILTFRVGPISNGTILFLRRGMCVSD